MINLLLSEIYQLLCINVISLNKNYQNYIENIKLQKLNEKIEAQKLYQDTYKNKKQKKLAWIMQDFNVILKSRGGREFKIGLTRELKAKNTVSSQLSALLLMILA